MKFKKKLLASLIFTGQINPASAALMRDDIDVQVYRDFGENRGVFAAGSINIPIYHTDGSLSGTIDVMPDLSASVDGGYSTLINSQASATATHVNYNDNISFAKRYQQLDATLFSGAENASSYELMNEVTKRAYEVDAGGDYKITRQRTIVTDVAPAELFTDTSQIKPGMLIARVGGGYLTVATGEETYTDLWRGKYGPMAGGLNIVGSMTTSGDVSTLSYLFTSEEKTALDVGARSADSGSGVWGWDTTSQSWKFLAVHSAHSGTAGYDSIKLYMRSAPDWTQATIDSFNDPAINTLSADDIIYVGAQNIHTGEGDFTLNGSAITYHGIRSDTYVVNRVSSDFVSNKNIILGGAGGTFLLNKSSVDLGAGSITFNSDYLLTNGGNNTFRLNSAGYIINEGGTVTSLLTGAAGDIWRKIGAGTLIISGSGENKAGLNVGDGLTILDRKGGHALKTLHIGSGRATVRLGAADQLEGTQVGFGNRGGVLDLYGQSLTWADIIHMDNGATIAATKADEISTFTFTGSGPKTYLGNFVDGGSAEAGLLHLVYTPSASGSSWTLKGNINTRGGMDILNGNLAVQGALTLHAAGFIDPTQYETATFDLGDSLVNLTGSQFTVGRNAMARGRFVLDDASTLLVTSGGELTSSEQGIQEGAYLDGSVYLAGANSALKVTAESAFLVQINAALSGVGHFIKEGLGGLYLTGDNHAYTGELEITDGSLILGSATSATGGDIRMTAGNLVLYSDINQINLSNLAAGTTVDLQGYSSTLNIKQSDLGSTIFSSGTDKQSSLSLLANNDITLNSTISGAFSNLIKEGLGSLTLTGNNAFTGDVSLNAGTTVLGNSRALGNAANIVTVSKDATLELAGKGALNTLNLDGGLLRSSQSGAMTLGKINLSADSTATFNGTADGIAIRSYQLNGHKLTMNNVFTSFGSVVMDNGDLTFNQSKLIWTAKNNILTGSTGSLTLGSGTVMEVRDVKQTAGQAKTLVLNGGTIASGTNGNGGEAGATFRSPLRVETSGTLLGNNTAFGINLGMYGAVSGSGTLNISGNQGVTLYGDTSAFDGKLLLLNASKLYLAPTADTTLAANITQQGTGKVFKEGTGNLTLTGDNHAYTNELDVTAGTLTLGSATSATGGDIRMTAGNLVLNSDIGLIKLSNLAAGTVVDLHGYSSTLNITQSAVGSAILSSATGKLSSLRLLANTDRTLNSTISGAFSNLIKEGLGSLTLAGINTFTGDVSLNAGTTVLGNSHALGNAANSVTVSKDATLDLAGKGTLNTLNLDGGLLRSSQAGAMTLGKINLSADSTATFNAKTDGVTIGSYQLNGHKLTMNNVYTEFKSAVLDDGDLVFNQSKLIWTAKNNILTGSTGALTLGSGTVMEVRDVKQTAGQAKTLVLNGGTIASGTNGNGGGAGATFRSPLRVQTSGTLLGNNTAFGLNLQFYGAISGSGTLNIAGNQGVSLYSDTSAFDGSLLMMNKSRLYLAPVADTTLAANLAQQGTGKVIKTGTSNLTLTGDNHAYTNEFEVSAGSLTLETATSATGGIIRMTGGRLIVANNSDFALGSTLRGTVGEVVKRGSGKLTLNKQNSYDQQTLVEEGILEIGDALNANATLAGDVQVSSGATLQGYGSLGGDLYNSGIVRPAGAGKSLRVSGNYTQTADSLLFIDIDPTKGASKLDIGGSATLAGGVKSLFAPGTYTAQNYVILSAKGGVNGTFASESQSGAKGLKQAFAYNSNDVVLSTSIVNVNPVKSVVQRNLVTSVASADPTDITDQVDSVDTLAQTYTADQTDQTDQTDTTNQTYATDETDKTDTTDQVTPTFVVKPSNLYAYDPQLLAIGLQKPNGWGMSQIDWASSWNQSACEVTQNCYSNDAMWILPHTSNGDGSANNMNAKINGILIGGYQESGNTRIGGSVDYSHFELSGDGSSAEADRFAVNVFASQKISDMVLTGGMGYTNSPTDVTRQVSSSGFLLGEGKGHTTAHAITSGVSLNWPVMMGGTQFVPQIGIDSLNVFYSGFDENMSAKDPQFDQVIDKMKVRGQSNRFDSLQPNVGFKISHELILGNTVVTPGLNVSYRRELMNNNDRSVSSNDGTMFAVPGNTLGRNIVEYEAGVTVKFSSSLSSTFSYTGSNQTGYQSQEGAIRMRYNF